MKYKILIVVANYYADISNNLLKKAKLILNKKANIKIINVPGVFEIPVVISKNIKKFDGFIALGCVIKGETPHFNFISNASTNAIMNLSIANKKPISNGIITCLNMKQAKARKKKGERKLYNSLPAGVRAKGRRLKSFTPNSRSSCSICPDTAGCWIPYGILRTAGVMPPYLAT